MLSARAYSFRLQARLAISLSWVAGYVNVVGWMVCGTAVSHVSGNVTHMGQGAADALTQGQFHGFGFFGFLVVCFLAGAAGSAVMTETARRRGKRSKYILPMIAEALLLSLFAIGLDLMRSDAGTIRGGVLGVSSTTMLYMLAGLASTAMGLQNATITKISGAVVRTTHLTGVVTDLGLEGVQLLLWYRDKFRGARLARSGRAGRVLALTRRHPTALRIALLASILGSFLLGVTVGAMVFAHAPNYAMLAPVAFLLWIIVIDHYTPIADVRELDVTADAAELSGLDLDGLKSLLPPDVGIYRLSHHRRRGPQSPHGAPDFQAWVDRLPARWRVLILAISPMTQLDADAVNDLRAATRRLQDQDRRMLLCGITPMQFKSLRKHGFFEVLEPADVCPDLEFAVARSLEVARVLAG